jgi:hypothetical protein
LRRDYNLSHFDLVICYDSGEQYSKILEKIQALPKSILKKGVVTKEIPGRFLFKKIPRRSEKTVMEKVVRPLITEKVIEFEKVHMRDAE